jgi:hypothetical protein
VGLSPIVWPTAICAVQAYLYTRPQKGILSAAQDRPYAFSVEVYPRGSRGGDEADADGKVQSDSKLSARYTTARTSHAHREKEESSKETVVSTARPTSIPHNPDNASYNRHGRQYLTAVRSIATPNESNYRRPKTNLTVFSKTSQIEVSMSIKTLCQGKPKSKRDRKQSGIPNIPFHPVIPLHPRPRTHLVPSLAEIQEQARKTPVCSKAAAGEPDQAISLPKKIHLPRTPNDSPYSSTTI